MRNGGIWLGLWCAVACGQELELPVQAAAGSDNRAGPSSGITGEAGAGDTLPPAGLPVAQEPLFDASGGAGGEARIADSGMRQPTAGRDAQGGTASDQPDDAQGGGAAVEGGGAGGASGPALAPALLFTEYVEGTGSLKALELYALAPSSLDGCELETYFNGKLEPGRLALHGTVATGTTYVLCSSALALLEPERCDRSTNLTFNGDDALALRCGAVVLDVIGQIGVDPGGSWGKGATADHTLRRACDVNAGRSDGSEPFDPSLEWSSVGPDAFDDLGQRTCAAAEHQ
jgi:hypothetical protein